MQPRLKKPLPAALVLALMLANPAGAQGNADVPTIRVGVMQIEPTWDPSRTIGALTMPLMKLVYDSLTVIGPDGTVVPQLATGWTSDDAGQSFVFTLREDVTFTNGDTFDAEDVRASLDYYVNTPTSTIGALLGNIAEIIVEGPHQVRFVQRVPDVTLPAVFTDRAGMMLSADVIASGDFAVPVGSGPYVLVAEQPGVSQEFEANPDHWNPDNVGADRIIALRYEDPVARANGLRSGDLDMTVVSANQIAEVMTTSGIQTYQIRGRQLRGLTLNPNVYEPLRDERVRRALDLSINRVGQAQGILLGEGEAASQYVLSTSPYFAPDVEPIPYDLDQARALLAEAGHADGLSFTMTSPPRYRREAEALQADWAQIGVTVDLIFPAGAGNARAIWYDQTVPVGIWAIDGRNDLGIFYRALFAPDAAFNPSRQAPEDLIALITEANTRVNEDERRAVFAEIAQLVTSQTQIQIPMSFEYQIVAYGGRLTNVTPWQGGFPYLHGVGVSN